MNCTVCEAPMDVYGPEWCTNHYVCCPCCVMEDMGRPNCINRGLILRWGGKIMDVTTGEVADDVGGEEEREVHSALSKRRWLDSDDVAT